jgi:hypothetical protein
MTNTALIWNCHCAEYLDVGGIKGRLHVEELHKFHTSRSIIIVVVSGKMGWVEHVARMGR